MFVSTVKELRKIWDVFRVWEKKITFKILELVGGNFLKISRQIKWIQFAKNEWTNFN